MTRRGWVEEEEEEEEGNMVGCKALVLWWIGGLDRGRAVSELP
jgi:hypothetical protein